MSAASLSALIAGQIPAGVAIGDFFKLGAVDGAAALPAVDGSLLTGITAASISLGTDFGAIAGITDGVLELDDAVGAASGLVKFDASGYIVTPGTSFQAYDGVGNGVTVTTSPYYVYVGTYDYNAQLSISPTLGTFIKLGSDQYNFPSGAGDVTMLSTTGAADALTVGGHSIFADPNVGGGVVVNNGNGYTPLANGLVTTFTGEPVVPLDSQGCLYYPIALSSVPLTSPTNGGTLYYPGSGSPPLADATGQLYYPSGQLLADNFGNLYTQGASLGEVVISGQPNSFLPLSNFLQTSQFDAVTLDGTGDFTLEGNGSITVTNSSGIDFVNGGKIADQDAGLYLLPNTSGAGGNLLCDAIPLVPLQAASAPIYQKGAIYFDTTLNKLRVGGATAWETITSV